MQTITSAKTSLRQVPALFKRWGRKIAHINLDVGGGAYNDGSDYLYNEFAITNLVFDPYNRSQEHNNRIQSLFDALKTQYKPSATLCNVLNVVRGKANRKGILKIIWDKLPKGSELFVSIYEGDRSGKGRVTPKGWQENRKAATYIEEIKSVGFLPVCKDGNLISFVKPLKG